MNRLILFIVVLTLFIGSNAYTQQANESWITLFNGKDLQGWDTYIGPDLDSAGKKITNVPVGLNKDPRQVFTIVEQDAEKIIRISGESWGGISTLKEYMNYHFQLKFKWGTQTWGQKKNKKRDSGLLYHAVGEHGADYGAWMRSQEFQIEETNTGDYWGVAGGIQDITAFKKADNRYVYAQTGTMYTFSATSPVGRHCVKGADAEAPSGEWNTIDLYCLGDLSIHMVNGKIMMVLYNSRQLNNGQETPLTKGKIQIQSEGAEIFYKGIKLQYITKIPADIMKEAGLINN
jgi:hypothetical protein